MPASSQHDRENAGQARRRGEHRLAGGTGKGATLANVSGLPLRLEALFYRKAGLDYHVAPHSHGIHQWFFLLHGGMTISVDGDFHELHAEDSLIIPPGAVRETWCRTRAPGYQVTIFDAAAVLDVGPICGRVLKMPAHLRDDVLALIAEVRHPAGPDAKLFERRAHPAPAARPGPRLARRPDRATPRAIGAQRA